jgi:hypothetical protein
MSTVIPLVADHLSSAYSASCRVSGITWRQRYAGISHVAYRDGKAIAGVSGPWSDRYVLIWWGEPTISNPLELFETAEAAKRVVEERVAQTTP